MSPDGKQYVTSPYHQEGISSWQWSGNRVEEVETFETDHFTKSVGVSEDWKTMVSGGHNGELKVWKLQSGNAPNWTKIKAEFHTSDIHIHEVGLSPDGKYVISSAYDWSSDKREVKIWDVASEEPISTLDYKNKVNQLEFLSGGSSFISAGDDGTIRFWDTQTGEEKLRFIAFSGGEWIIMTPEGYFDASENGAQYLKVRIGNHVYPIDNFFETYYRPDIVRSVLKGDEQTTAVASDIRKEATLPPSVRILFPENGQELKNEQVTVKIEATDQGGGIDEVKLYHNGKLVQTTGRGLQAKSQKSYSYQVQLVSGENVLEATAFNDNRIEAKRERVEVTYQGAEASAELYLLSVGINEYKNASLNLNYGRTDAESFTEAVQQKGKNIFSDIIAYQLFDDQATRENMVSSMEEIINRAGPEDAFLFFYAGHGVMSEKEGGQEADFYMALHETVRLYGDNAGLNQTGISATELTELTRKIAARKQMIILDACQSGGAVETFAVRGAAEQKAILQLARSAGLVVMASTGTEQYATEFGALGHGVFTYALLNGLYGKADGGSQDGKITVKELEAFINDRVPALTEKHRGQAQYPNSYARGQDFPIGITDQ